MNLDTLTLDTPHHDAATRPGAVVANWHDENHEGSFRLCQEQPCAAVRDADGGCRF